MSAPRAVSTRGRVPSASATAATAASSSASASSVSPRYKAVTRELLLGLCKKHFSLRAVGSSAGTTGTSREAKAAAARENARLHTLNNEDFGMTALQTRTESLEHYLKRATHLQLDHQKLSHTLPVAELALAHGQSPADTSFSSAKAMRVLYLHDNNLTTLDDFSFCKGALSHLYLQNNNISRMENLLELQNLEKLYLGGNRIQSLEGFAKEDREPQQPDERPAPPAPFFLVELHLDSQRLPSGVGLQLSIPSIQALSSSLTILTLASNGMDSDAILPISLLGRLTVLDLANNRIDDIKMLSEMCSYLPDLHTLDLRGNPVNSGPTSTAVTQKKYRDRIVTSSRSINLLDDKEVPSNQREYLHSLAAQKRLKRSQAAAASSGEPELTDEQKKFAALHTPPQFPYQPKVLTLRTSPLPGSISVGQLGGLGAGTRNTLQHHAALGNTIHLNQSTTHRAHAPSAPAYSHARSQSHANVPSYAASSSSYEPSPFIDEPFDDDDPNLGGGGHGGGYGGGGGGFEDDFGGPDDGGAPYDNGGAPYGNDGPPYDNGGDLDRGVSQLNIRAAEADPIPGREFTGDPTRLNDLLESRGLVSAFTEQTDGESARNRRADMNKAGWDGGRTRVVSATHQRKDSASSTSAATSAARARSRNSSMGQAK